MKNSARGELVEPCELCVSVVKKDFGYLTTKHTKATKGSDVLHR